MCVAGCGIATSAYRRFSTPPQSLNLQGLLHVPFDYLCKVHPYDSGTHSHFDYNIVANREMMSTCRISILQPYRGLLGFSRRLTFTHFYVADPISIFFRAPRVSCSEHKHIGSRGLEAVYPKPRLSVPDREARKYPYLPAGLAIERPDQVWATDITDIRMRRGFRRSPSGEGCRRESMSRRFRQKPSRSRSVCRTVLKKVLGKQIGW